MRGRRAAIPCSSPRAEGHRGALVAARRARGADRRAELHERLIPVAGVSVAVGDERLGQPPQAGVAAGRLDVVLDREEAGEDAGHVPVDDGGPPAEGDAGDGPGRVGADTLEASELLERARYDAVVLQGDLLGGRVEHAGTPVVAKAAPEGEHALLRRLREVPDGRELPEKALVVGNDRADARLLEHRLADPHRVRVARPSPGQIPPDEARTTAEGRLGGRRAEGPARLRAAGGFWPCRRPEGQCTPSKHFLPDDGCAMFRPWRR